MLSRSLELIAPLLNEHRQISTNQETQADGARLRRMGIVLANSKASSQKFLKSSEPETERLVKIASYDHHCHPDIILKLQGSLPSASKALGSGTEFTTQKISSLIWELSSSKNIRLDS